MNIINDEIEYPGRKPHGTNFIVAQKILTSETTNGVDGEGVSYESPMHGYCWDMLQNHKLAQLTQDQILWLLTAVRDTGDLIQNVPSSLSDLCLRQDLVAAGACAGSFRLTRRGTDVWRQLRQSRQNLRGQSGHS
jgi:hypothetical protein